MNTDTRSVATPQPKQSPRATTLVAGTFLLACLSTIPTVQPAQDPTRPANWQAPVKKMPAKTKPRRAAKAPAPEAPLLLQGIVMGQSQRIALINSKWLKVSDSIDGAKVVDIRAQQVTVSRQGKIFELPLIQQTVAKRSAAAPSTPISTGPSGPSKPASPAGFVKHSTGHHHGR